MFDLNTINSALNKAKNNSKKLANKFDKEYKLAVEKYNLAIEAENNQKLKDVAKNFSKLIKIKKSKPEPYYYLSLIYFVFDEELIAKEYFEIYKELSQEQKQIDYLENVLFNDYLSKVE